MLSISAAIHPTLPSPQTRILLHHRPVAEAEPHWSD
ncbi:hypothetical protein CORC01_14155 [Colletotrichum orchidophilum]|uniref:Uncharacterized protein n=1 Tax=Colletotrichum orchidophilum TaxID=1209926 RepID=A0A1G4AN06_9PEZI|nr:uncharacterized protein CORC01_14155 [Colletotrichum orchidophilum]OHE90547.1 hypothetical protein CORC01_14155 [Colletotrichum orchidophilum]